MSKSSTCSLLTYRRYRKLCGGYNEVLIRLHYIDMRKSTMSSILSAFSLILMLIPFPANAATIYTTWDPSNKGANVDLTGSNLVATKNNAAWQSVRSVLGVSTGKWYWEMTLANGFIDGGAPAVGIGNASGLVSNDFSVNVNGWGATNDTGTSGGAIKKRTNNANSAYAANAFGNSTIGVYYDADAGNLGFIAADGTDLGNAFTGLAAGTYYAYASNYSNTSSWTANFGATNFSHSVPGGYNAGLYVDTTVTGTGTANRLAKFTATSTIGDSLFSDDGSNMTLTAGNLFMQISSLIDTVTSGAFNLGTTNATTMTFGRSGQNMIINSNVGIGTSTPSVALQVNGTINFGAASTASNCNSTASPATCGAAPAGSVAMSTGTDTLVVDTTAVTANSQILITEDSSLGSRLGITCNTGTNRAYTISARTASTNFTVKSTNNPVTNKACLSYWIVN